MLLLHTKICLAISVTISLASNIIDGGREETSAAFNPKYKEKAVIYDQRQATFIQIKMSVWPRTNIVLSKYDF